MKEKNELYPTPAFAFPLLEKSKLFHPCLESLSILWPCLQSFSRPIAPWIYFSEDGWLTLYRQNIPLMPYMSVIVSNLPEVYCLICSKNGICFIAVSHWWFIIIQGSANKPRHFFSLFFPNLWVLGLQQPLLFMVPEWVTLHFDPLKSITQFFQCDAQSSSNFVSSACVLDIN